MHVLIETFGSHGDVLPFRALGAELVRRGHRVEVHANEVFRDTLESAGLEHVPSATEEEYRRAERDPRLWHPRRGLELIWKEGILPSLRARVEALLARQGPDTVMIGSVLAFAPRLVRELRPPAEGGAPLLTAHLAPSAFFSVHRAPRFPGLWMPVAMPAALKRAQYALVELALSRVVNRSLNGLRAELGLGAVTHVFDRWIHSPDGMLALFPDWFGPPQPDWPPGLVPSGFLLEDDGERRPMGPELEAWLAAGSPPIVAVAGSANLSAERSFHRIVGAARRLGRRVLLATRNERALPAQLAGEDALRVDYAPFGALLPRAAALVSHGGVGTCAQALRAGIPHLVLWHAYDQLDNASRLTGLGTGKGLRAKGAGTRSIERALAWLLSDPAVSTACRAWSERIDPAGALAAAVERVETLRP